MKHKQTTSNNQTNKAQNEHFQFFETARELPKIEEPNKRKINFKEIYSDMDSDQSSQQASRCLDCGNPYCEWKCPLHNYIPNWLELVSNEKFQQAGELMYETNPLPEICGRVCPQDRLCEQACTINTGFGAVTIGAIEKNVTDRLMAKQWRPDLSEVKPMKKSVAVIGAGPAGLACADQLIRNGVRVIVYDQYPEIGGLLTFGIPGFKLEKNVIRKRRKFLQDLGVEFRLNTLISNDLKADTGQQITVCSFDKIEAQNDAIFLAMGTYTSVKSGLPGSNATGVLKALEYLIGNINHLENYQMDSAEYHQVAEKNVIVIGGGDTAMDCVRTAIRQGAKSVRCVYRRDKNAMPGSPREVANAQEEGAEFVFNTAPLAIQHCKGNKVSGLKVASTYTKIDPDTNSTTLLLDKNKMKVLSADVVIIAFGFKASPAKWFDSKNIATKPNGLVELISSHSKQTSNAKVYSGGDMINGADLVVTAVADGISAAKEIIESFE